MDRTRTDGASRKVAGSIKEAIGKLTGNRRTSAEGRAEKIAGKAEAKAGLAKDRARDATGH